MLRLSCVLGLNDPRPCGIESRNTWMRGLVFGKGILYDTHISVYLCLILLEWWLLNCVVWLLDWMIIVWVLVKSGYLMQSWSFVSIAMLVLLLNKRTRELFDKFGNLNPLKTVGDNFKEIRISKRNHYWNSVILF